MRQRITIEMIRELSEARVPLDTRLAALLKTSREPLRDDLVDAMAAWFGIPSPTGDAGRALLIELAIQLHVHIDNPWLASIQGTEAGGVACVGSSWEEKTAVPAVQSGPERHAPMGWVG